MGELHQQHHQPAREGSISSRAVPKTMARRSKGRSKSPARPTATAKLAFVEALLAAPTLVAASNLGIEWLVDHLRVKQAALAIADSEKPGSASTVIASRGLDVSALGDLVLDLSLAPAPAPAPDPDPDPDRDRGPDLGSVRVAFASGHCEAFLLLCPGGGERKPIGLLLLGGVGRDPAIEWLLDVLARRLVDLRDRQVLEAAVSARSQRFADMAHELRTPLNAILGYTSNLLEGVSGPLPPPVRRQLSRVDANGKQLLVIINDVLDVSSR